jgi:hypothetical protein
MPTPIITIRNTARKIMPDMMKEYTPTGVTQQEEYSTAMRTFLKNLYGKMTIHKNVMPYEHEEYTCTVQPTEAVRMNVRSIEGMI